MPAISAQLLNNTLGGMADNQYLTTQHDRFNWVAMPFFSEAPSAPGPSFLQKKLSIYAHHRIIKAQKLGAYLDDYYNRIHIIPVLIDLGNVSSTQGFSVTVWNAYMTPQKVTDVTGQKNGVSVIPPAPLTYEIPGLLETSWGVNVDNNGEPVIDECLNWIFQSAQAPVVYITGSRVVMWPFVPDWSEPVQERLEWATDIISSSTGAEQRRALRISPKRALSARFLVYKNERTHFDLLLAGNGSGQWSLPLWDQMQTLREDAAKGTTEILCETAGREFRPGLVLIIRGADVSDIFSIETAAIDLVLADRIRLQRPLQNAWPAGTRFYPAVAGRIVSQPTLERVTDQIGTTSVTFELVERSDWNAELPNIRYRGFPVFENTPDESTNLTNQYLRIIQTLKSTPGFDYVRDSAKAGFMAQGHAWFLYGAQEVSDFKKLVYALRGCQVPVWVPTFTDDLRLERTSSNDILFIQKVGLSRFGFDKVGKRDIRIERTSGLTTYHRITAATELNATTERLEIEPILSDILTPDNVGRICFMALSRLDSDVVNINHEMDAAGLAKVSLVWRSLRDELEVEQ